MPINYILYLLKLPIIKQLHFLNNLKQAYMSFLLSVGAIRYYKLLHFLTITLDKEIFLLRFNIKIFPFLIFVSLWLISSEIYASKFSTPSTNIYTTEWARLRHQAAEGNPDALFTLGSFYYKPPKRSHINKNLKKAAEYYFKAAIRGNAAAQYNFAIMLHRGLGVTKNLTESYVFFKLASFNKSPVAKHTNEVAKKSALQLKNSFDSRTLISAGERLVFYTNIIKKENYRKAKFPD